MIRRRSLRAHRPALARVVEAHPMATPTTWVPSRRIHPQTQAQAGNAQIVDTRSQRGDLEQQVQQQS